MFRQPPGTKGNVGQQSTHRAQSRIRVTQALDRVRQAARQRKKERFTALLHHINVDTLKTAFRLAGRISRRRMESSGQ
jgi:RNA-directed DNA polymerase